MLPEKLVKEITERLGPTPEGAIEYLNAVVGAAIFTEASRQPAKLLSSVMPESAIKLANNPMVPDQQRCRLIRVLKSAGLDPSCPFERQPDRATDNALAIARWWAKAFAVLKEQLEK